MTLNEIAQFMRSNKIAQQVVVKIRQAVNFFQGMVVY